ALPPRPPGGAIGRGTRAAPAASSSTAEGIGNARGETEEEAGREEVGGITMKSASRVAIVIAFIISAPAACLFAEAAPVTSPDQRAQQLTDRGLTYLKSQQKPDGGWQSANDPPGVTAIVLR